MPRLGTPAGERDLHLPALSMDRCADVSFRPAAPISLGSRSSTPSAGRITARLPTTRPATPTARPSRRLSCRDTGSAPSHPRALRRTRALRGWSKRWSWPSSPKRHRSRASRGPAHRRPDDVDQRSIRSLPDIRFHARIATSRTVCMRPDHDTSGGIRDGRTFGRAPLCPIFIVRSSNLGRYPRHNV